MNELSSRYDSVINQYYLIYIVKRQSSIALVRHSRRQCIFKEGYMAQHYCSGCGGNIGGKPLKVKIKGERYGYAEFHNRLCLASYRGKYGRGPKQIVFSAKAAIWLLLLLGTFVLYCCFRWAELRGVCIFGSANNGH